MKIIFSFTIGIFVMVLGTSTTALSQSDKSWTVTKSKGSFVLQNMKFPNAHIEAISSGEPIRIEKVETHETHNHIELIRYYAGAHGTMQLVDQYIAVVFDTKDGKILGQFPYRYEFHSGKSGKLTQPKWTASKSKITIFDPETTRTHVLKIQSH